MEAPPAMNAPGLLDHHAYLGFLKSKFRFDTDAGFVVPRSAINPMLKPHQMDLVEWMVRKGRAACFAAFGLGKSFIQLEASRLVQENTGGRCLIILPLGVRQEFRVDAAKLGITVTFVNRSEQVAGPGIYLTNYESVRDGKIDPALFDCVSLDEASVLRGYGTKTYQEFLTILRDVRFRFVATATPSPNEHKELIHYAGFLGIMDTGQALTRFFKRDTEKAGNLTLLPHMEREFWLWLHSWAAFVQKPSDLGHDDAGYTMPPLVVRVHEVAAGDISGGQDRDGQMRLIRDAAMGLKEAATEKRDSIDARVAKMAEIVGQDPTAHFVLWHDLEAERHAIKRALPEAVEVFGSLDLEEREKRIIGFSEGEFRLLATKPEISGSGCNFQRHCHRAIFLGIGFKFNDFIQAIHRIRRFLQTQVCEIDIIICETEREVWRTLERKWREHDALTERMSTIIGEHGLSTLGLERELARTIGVVRRQEDGERFSVAHNDTVLECDRLPANSMDLIVTSIPFGNHYEYSATYEDFGHNDDHGRFFEQMGYLTPNLLRILKPGRIFACHVKDRIRFGNVTGMGMPTVEPFHCDTIMHYRAAGFAYMGMITVVTDVVRENNQTYRLGWSEQCKDGSKMGVGSPEYILLFRKLPSDLSTAYADVPVVKTKDEYTRGRWQIDAHAFWRSSGNGLLNAAEFDGLGPDVLAKAFPDATLRTVYDHQAHVAVAEELDRKGKLPSTFMAVAPGSWHPDVWHDVVRMRTLNGKQASRNLVQHICPLQLDIVERLIERYSNPGEVVFDPFGGLMTVPYCAIRKGRRGAAVELNGDYFRDGVAYLREIEREVAVPTLFDMLASAGPAAAVEPAVHAADNAAAGVGFAA